VPGEPASDAGYVASHGDRPAGTAVDHGRESAEGRLTPLPKTDHALLLRTNFSDDAAWTALCEAVRRPASSPRTSIRMGSSAASRTA